MGEVKIGGGGEGTRGSCQLGLCSFTVPFHELIFFCICTFCDE